MVERGKEDEFTRAPGFESSTFSTANKRLNERGNETNETNETNEARGSCVDSRDGEISVRSAKEDKFSRAPGFEPSTMSTATKRSNLLSYGAP